MQDKIEQYLEDKLSPQEKKEFESEMLMNQSLYLEIEKRKEILDSISQQLAYNSMFTTKEDKALLNREQEISIEEDIIEFHKERKNNNEENEIKLKSIISEITNNNNNFVREVNPIYKLVASIMLFILMTGSVYYYIHSSNMKKRENTVLLASQFFLPGQDDFLNQIKHNLDIQRNAAEFKNRTLPSEADTDILISQNLLLIEAISDIENKELQSARKKLQKLHNEFVPDIDPAVLWYYAILTAKEGNYKEASRLLKKISTGNNYYSSSADTLLKRISMN